MDDERPGSAASWAESKNEMSDDPKAASPIPPDDPDRSLTVARPETDQTLTRLGLVGDTCTILVTGEQTGRGPVSAATR